MCPQSLCEREIESLTAHLRSIDGILSTLPDSLCASLLRHCIAFIAYAEETSTSNACVAHAGAAAASSTSAVSYTDAAAAPSTSSAPRPRPSTSTCDRLLRSLTRVAGPVALWRQIQQRQAVTSTSGGRDTTHEAASSLPSPRQQYQPQVEVPSSSQTHGPPRSHAEHGAGSQVEVLHGLSHEETSSVRSQVEVLHGLSHEETSALLYTLPPSARDEVEVPRAVSATAVGAAMRGVGDIMEDESSAQIDVEGAGEGLHCSRSTMIQVEVEAGAHDSSGALIRVEVEAGVHDSAMELLIGILSELPAVAALLAEQRSRVEAGQGNTPSSSTFDHSSSSSGSGSSIISDQSLDDFSATNVAQLVNPDDGCDGDVHSAICASAVISHPVSQNTLPAAVSRTMPAAEGAVSIDATTGVRCAHGTSAAVAGRLDSSVADGDDGSDINPACCVM